jgi:DNA-binding MarR family transcriptional regulator
MIINFVSNPDEKPIFEDLGASALTKEDFSQLDTLIQGNVFSAHEITTPALFGVATPGSLGQHTELRDGYEIFKNTYVNEKQQFLEEVFNRLAELAGIAPKLYIIPTSPLAMELSEATISGVMTKDEIREKAGLPKIALAPGTEVQQEADRTPVNDHIKNLTGKQMQHLSRVVRQFSQGKISRAQAASLLKASFGMSDTDIDVWLNTEDEATPQQFSDEAALLLFAEYGTPRAGYKIVKSRKAKFSADSDVEVLEHAYLSFAGEAVTALQASILELISKDKLISPATLAQVLKVEVAEVVAALAVLEGRDAIKTTGGAGAEERTLTAPLKELQEGVKTKRTALQVRYSYEGPQDDRNRPFCAKLMELDRLYSRKDIEAISERLGYSVWDRRGGWYTVPGTDQRRPYCRHTWMSNVVIAE